MSDNENKNDLDKDLDQFLGQAPEQECTGEECIIKTDKSIIERVNKKIITDDGRQLLM